MEQRVSVLITFYNQEEYVDRALKSVIDQETDFGVKILVGDDGSTDKTRDVVKKWIDLYPDVIEMYVLERTRDVEPSGFRASRNRLNLLSHVETEYFNYLDGDDYFDYTCKLQEQVRILDDPSNLDCIACGHNADMMYSDGRRVPIVSKSLKEGKYSSKEYWSKYYFHTDTLLVRSSVIPYLNTKKLENSFNDELITFSLIQKGKLYYIPQIWAVYYLTGDGIWTDGKNVMINKIRSMICFDLCNQLNPDMHIENNIRHASVWMYFLRNRNKIAPFKLEQFSHEAKDKNLVNVYRWIHYRELGLLMRQSLCLRALGIYLQRMVSRGLSKVMHKNIKNQTG